jgi:hypothetical protein
MIVSMTSFDIRDRRKERGRRAREGEEERRHGAVGGGMDVSAALEETGRLWV